MKTLIIPRKITYNHKPFGKKLADLFNRLTDNSNISEFYQKNYWDNKYFYGMSQYIPKNSENILPYHDQAIFDLMEQYQNADDLMGEIIEIPNDLLDNFAKRLTHHFNGQLQSYAYGFQNNQFALNKNNVVNERDKFECITTSKHGFSAVNVRNGIQITYNKKPTHFIPMETGDFIGRPYSLVIKHEGQWLLLSYEPIHNSYYPVYVPKTYVLEENGNHHESEHQISAPTYLHWNLNVGIGHSKLKGYTQRMFIQDGKLYIHANVYQGRDIKPYQAFDLFAIVDFPNPQVSPIDDLTRIKSLIGEQSKNWHQIFNELPNKQKTIIMDIQ